MEKTTSFASQESAGGFHKVSLAINSVMCNPFLLLEVFGGERYLIRALFLNFWYLYLDIFPMLKYFKKFIYGVYI